MLLWHRRHPGTAVQWLPPDSPAYPALPAPCSPAQPPLPHLLRYLFTQVWAGFYFSNALLPLCMAYTFLTPHINWAGITYTRRRGKIASVRHGC